MHINSPQLNRVFRSAINHFHLETNWTKIGIIDLSWSKPPPGKYQTSLPQIESAELQKLQISPFVSTIAQFTKSHESVQIKLEFKSAICAMRRLKKTKIVLSNRSCFADCCFYDCYFRRSEAIYKTCICMIDEWKWRKGRFRLMPIGIWLPSWWHKWHGRLTNHFWSFNLSNLDRTSRAEVS